MINKHKYELCRLCLCSGGSLINIIEGSNNLDFMVVMTLEDLLKIKVVKEAGYPWLVCNSCIDKLTEFRLFKRRCNECLFVFYNRIQAGAKDESQQGEENVSGDIPSVNDKKNDDGNEGTEVIGSAGDVSAKESGFKSLLETTDHSLQRPGVQKLPLFTTRGGTEMGPASSSRLKEMDAIVFKEENDSIDIPVDNSIEAADTSEGIVTADGVSAQVRGNASPMDAIVRSKLMSVAQVADSGFSSVAGMQPTTSVDPKRMDLLGPLQMPGVEPRQDDVVACKTEEDSDDDDFGDGALAEGAYVTQGQEASNVECSPVGTAPIPLSLTAKQSVFVDDLAEDPSSRAKRLPDRKSKKKDFECDICGSMFGSKLLIEKHMRKHLRDDFFHCETCFMGFIDRDEFQKHASVPCEVNRSKDKSSGGIEFYHCGTCLVGFIKKAEYDKHISNHGTTEGKGGGCGSGRVSGNIEMGENSDAVLKPPEVPREGLCVANVSVDVKTSEEMGNPSGFGADVDCGEVDKGVLSAVSVSNEVSVEKSHVCDECGDRFQEIGQLKDHMSVHSAVKPFPCSVCSKSFTRKTNLKTHLAIHLKEKPYSCNVCPMEFTARAKLTHHMKTHADLLPYTCTVCFKMFSRSRNLKAHMRLHSGEKAFVCTMCPKTFRVKNSLTVHLRTHTGEKPYTCKVCGKAFTQVCGLKVHVARHNGEKAHACTECPKAFVERADLRKHMNVHAKEKPFACNVCSRAFVAEKNLEKHMAIHTGMKPFSCEICSKSFSVKFNLKAHMVVHGAEKPYVCDVCSRAFSRKRSLHSHMVVHNDSRYKCEQCPFKSPSKLEVRRHVQRMHWITNPESDSPPNPN
ncbi:zinc finger protein 791-like [Hetaerina americana]|uniref:zinc finger protein 791-like n=1 Tax=Hetaerina americana TaxID=62018 RepID=UPI003A7F4F42